MAAKKVTQTKAQDEAALRTWMEETFHGLRDDRSTASYALEFLKTGQTQFLEETRLIQLTAAMEAYKKVSDQIASSAAQLKTIAEYNATLIATVGK